MLQLHGGFRVRVKVSVRFFSVRHLMNGCDLKYTFPQYHMVNVCSTALYVYLDKD